MSVRNDVINLTVNINGSAAQNQLNELRKRAADLTFEMKNNLTKGTQEYITAAKDLKQVNAEMTNLKQSIGLSALSLKELSAEQKNLTALFRSAQPGTQAYKDFENQLKAVILRQKELSANTSGFTGVATSSFNSIKQSITSLALGYVGFQAVITGVRALTAGAIKLSDQLGDLRRIAGLTKDEANNLNHSLLQIDTRTSGEGLRSIAIVAGKLGVAKEDIFSFTKAVDKLVVTLGDELGNADQITTQLGKILNVFEGKVTGENISKLGNAFVELANAGVATGGFIADFTQRVSGIAKASNLSLGSTVGLAAGFEELGLRSESSSTALQKLLTTIASDLPKAAKFANVPLKEFSQLFAEKPQEALIKYAEGLAKNKNSFAEIAASFKDADEKGARVVQTLQAIGQKGDFLREKIDQGNTSIERQTALNDGFAIKNENLAGTIEKLGKAFDKLIANERVTNFLQGIINTLSGAITGIEDFIDSFDSLDQAVTKITKKHEADLANFASEIGGEFEKKSIAEQQKLADSYKSIYISSQKALTEFLKSGNGDIAQRTRMNKFTSQRKKNYRKLLRNKKKKHRQTLHRQILQIQKWIQNISGC
jgi:TP901 family phage tail tape measure protein